MLDNTLSPIGKHGKKKSHVNIKYKHQYFIWLAMQNTLSIRFADLRLELVMTLTSYNS